MKIAALDAYTLNPDGDNPWDEIAALGDLTVYDRTPSEKFFERAESADIILTNKVVLDAARISALPRLKFISVLATGYNVVDISAAKARGIPVCNAPLYCTDSVAQHVVAMVLNHLNAVSENSADVMSGLWAESKDFCRWKKPVRLLSEMSIGIIGMGAIGRRVAEMFQALGTREILYFNRTPLKCDFATEASIEEIFSKCDVVTLHCALGSDNVKFANGELFSKMRDGALFVNTARGGLVNEVELACELKKGRIFAALDVLSKEPPDADNPLIGLPNCVLTAHMAWSALESRRALMRITRDNILGFLSGNIRNRVA